MDSFTWLESLIAQNEHLYVDYLNTLITGQNSLMLIPLAFVGGLIASLSPCILGLLPLNLGYIGSLQAKTKQATLLNASLFVLGVVVVLSLFGLFSSFAGAVVVDFKGYLYLGVAVFSVLMGLVLLEKVPFPTLPTIGRMPTQASPFVVGVLFSLVTSPCASPVLLTVLVSAASTGNVVISVLTMMAYAMGYAFVLFISSLFTGFSSYILGLKHHGKTITTIGSLLLIASGLFYAYAGIRWFVGA